MKKLLLIVLPLFFILLFTCCSASKENNSIVGKWELEEGTSTKGLRIVRELEFFSDGTVQSNYGGKYTIEEERLNIYYSAMDSYSYIFRLENDLLILQSNDSSPDKSEYRYFRTDTNEDANFDESNEADKNNEEQLAAVCDYILAEGTNKNGDIYQLVANESKSYDGKSEVGIIKNNKWLIELSSDSPFVDESGKIIYIDNYMRQFDYPESDDLYGYSKTYMFINNCCFIAKEDSRNHYDVILNAENGKNYIVENGWFETEFKDDNLIGQYDENIVIRDWDSKDKSYEILNTETMSIVKEFTNDDFYYITPISEGVFYAIKDKEGNGKAFYDSNGQKVVDLSKYKISGCGFFIDGRCIFTAINSSGKEFEITIDKSGNVISEKPVE